MRKLIHHAETLIKDEERVNTWKEKVREAMRNCGYPEWALKEGEQLSKRQKRREEEVDGQGGQGRQEKPRKAFAVIPYMIGVT